MQIYCIGISIVSSSWKQWSILCVRSMCVCWSGLAKRTHTHMEPPHRMDKQWKQKQQWRKHLIDSSDFLWSGILACANVPNCITFNNNMHYKIQYSSTCVCVYASIFRRRNDNSSLKTNIVTITINKRNNAKCGSRSAENYWKELFRPTNRWKCVYLKSQSSSTIQG